MSTADLHKLLNVSKTASLQEIKKAYRSLAMKYHPDLHPPEKRLEYEEKFKKITVAYSTLTQMKDREKTWTPSKTGRRNWDFHYYQVEYSGPYFDVKLWQAWHYGTGAIAEDSVKFIKSSQDMGRHAKQYMKRNRQEGVKLDHQMALNEEEHRKIATSNLQKRREERLRHDSKNNSGCTVS
jgi:DnaJ-class molecular chaperone